MERISTYLLLALCIPLFSSAQVTLKGRVQDERSGPVAGASIHLLNTQVAAISDKEGRFSLYDMDEGHYILSVSSIGYATISEPVTVSDTAGEIQIIMHPYFRQLGEVTVSTQKRDELLQHVPLSITAFSSKQVADYRLWNINELTSLSPNLYISDPGDKRNVTSVRGIVSTSYDPAIATYVDGVNQFGLDTYMAQLFDVERIEVARGPQGTLYGRNAMGGVINIFTRQPENKVHGFAELNLGNYDQKRMTAGIKGPLIKDRLFFGAAGLFEKRDGFYTNLFNHSDYDQQHATSGNYFLKFLAKSHWDITWNVKHTANRNKGAFPLVFGKDEAFKDPFTLNQNAVTKMIDNIFNTSLSVSHAGRLFNLSSQTAYQSNYRYYTHPIDADFSPADAISIIDNYGKEWNHVKVVTEEFKLSSRAHDQSKLNWTAGTYLFYQHSPVKQATQFGNDAMMLGAPDNNFSLISETTAKSKGMAFYGQGEYKLVQKLSLIAGIRYDYEYKRQNVLGEYQKDPDPGPRFAFRPDTSAAADFHAFSPRLGVTWYPSSSNTVFINYSKGFRAGGLTPLSSDPSQPPLFAFKPEISNSIDMGTKNTFFNKRLMLDLSVFYSGISDVQVPTLMLPDAVTITRNTGKLSSKGIELEARSVFHGFEWSYSFGYTKATYDYLKLSKNGTEVNLQGKRQVFTPDVMSMLAGQYTIGLNSERTLHIVLRGEWRYLGKQYFDLANTIGQSPCHLLHAKLGVEKKSFSILFWGRNLNNARYISYAYDFGAVHLGDPRNYGMAIHLNF